MKKSFIKLILALEFIIATFVLITFVSFLILADLYAKEFVSGAEAIAYAVILSLFSGALLTAFDKVSGCLKPVCQDDVSCDDDEIENIWAEK